jgi:protein-L-isoaspartate O-methyltransferase
LEQARYWADRCRLKVTPDGNGGHWSAYDVLCSDEQRYKACPSWTPEQVREVARRVYPASIAHYDRHLGHLANRLAYERAMLADAGGTVADRTGPEVGGGCRCWASPRGGWSYIRKVNKVSVTVEDNWGNGGQNFTRTIAFDKLAGVMTKADVDAARVEGRLIEIDTQGFMLCDSAPKAPTVEAPKPEAGAFEAMRESLAAGVQVVSAPQLFPTPRDLAARMVDLADIQPGHAVLEPSAGTGALMGAMGGRMFGHAPESGRLVAVEINATLAHGLPGEFPLTTIYCADFTQWQTEERFDRVLMNPPFANGADIEHIQRAAAMLKPGGRLVAICANGPRQAARLQPLADSWEELPAGTFAHTGVRAVLLTINKGREA